MKWILIGKHSFRSAIVGRRWTEKRCPLPPSLSLPLSRGLSFSPNPPSPFDSGFSCVLLSTSSYFAVLVFKLNIFPFAATLVCAVCECAFCRAHTNVAKAMYLHIAARPAKAIINFCAFSLSFCGVTERKFMNTCAPLFVFGVAVEHESLARKRSATSASSSSRLATN